MPDVLFVDGGKGQLAEAMKVLDALELDWLTVVAVAKGRARRPGAERLFRPGSDRPLQLPPDSPALLLIQQIRDEAHRFAITGHRQRRAKARRKSPLEHIPGLGPKRRRELLRQFGGLQGVVAAGIDDLAKVRGISRKLACFYSPMEYARPIAAVLFGLAAVTDMIDGWVARRFGQMSRFGEFLDPVADKLMVAITLVMLVQADSGWFEDIIAMIIIGREITISALREWMATIGERANVKVDVTGKIKTTLQMFGIGFMVYQHDFLGLPIYTIGFVLLVLAAIMTIWSMIVYLRAAWPFIKADSAD